MKLNGNRVTLYRRYKRLKAALNSLIENKVLSPKACEPLKQKIEEVYAEWKAEFRKERAKTARPRGRPKLVDPRTLFTKCKNEKCPKPPAPGQVYCSRACSPFGYYDMKKAG